MRIFVGLIAVLHVANVAQCCCGHYCPKPNDVCSERPSKGGC
jgi:hypothetical protein